MAESLDCNRQIRDLLEGLHLRLAIPLSSLSDIISLSEPDLLSVLNGNLELNILQFSRLAKHFNFSLESFSKADFDSFSITSMLPDQRPSIPEKYRIGARSQIRAFHNIARFVRNNYSESAFNLLLRHFQISETAWRNLNEPVNVFLIEDSLALIQSWGLGERHIVDIGKASTEVARGSLFAHKLAHYTTPKQMFEHYLEEHIRLVETNSIYRIRRIDATECVFTSDDNADLVELFSGKPLGGPNRCHYRRGALAAAPRYIGLPDADVVETQCIHRGDPQCIFRVDFQWADYVRRKKQYD